MLVLLHVLRLVVIWVVVSHPSQHAWVVDLVVILIVLLLLTLLRRLPRTCFILLLESPSSSSTLLLVLVLHWILLWKIVIIKIP